MNRAEDTVGEDGYSNGTQDSSEVSGSNDLSDANRKLIKHYNILFSHIKWAIASLEKFVKSDPSPELIERTRKICLEAGVESTLLVADTLIYQLENAEQGSEIQALRQKHDLLRSEAAAIKVKFDLLG